jgi:hypothetical protein
MTLDCVKWFELYGSHQPFETDVPQVKLLLLGLVFKKTISSCDRTLCVHYKLTDFFLLVYGVDLPF